MIQRFDPAGQVKRLATGDEPRCSQCFEFRTHSDFGWPACGSTEYLSSPKGCSSSHEEDSCDGCDNCRCEPDDFAGDCPFFNEGLVG